MGEQSFEFWRKRTVIDRDGEKIGTVDDVFIDDATEVPEWLLVDTGLLSRSAVIPLVQVVREPDDSLRVPFTRDQIKEAPTIDTSGEITQEDERKLYEHFGVAYSDDDSPSLLPMEGRGLVGEENDNADTRGQSAA